MESVNNQTRTSLSQGSGENGEEAPDEWLMSCRSSSAKAMSTLLSCLNLQQTGASKSNAGGEGPATQSKATQSTTRRMNSKGPQLVTVFCNEKSLSFHVRGASKQFQASIEISSSWFSDYRVAQALPLSEDEENSQPLSPGGEFCLNLTSVLECLQVLGTNALDRIGVCLSYNATQEHLRMELVMQECGVISTSIIPGMIPPDEDMLDEGNDAETITGHGLHVAFRSSKTVGRIIFRSDTLRQIIPELESVVGASVATVGLSEKRGFEIGVVGHLGECIVAVPAKGNHVVMMDAQNGRRALSSFPLHSIMASFRGLEMAQETCITMNANGMMAVQHQVLLQSSEMGDSDGAEEAPTTPCFVEFLLCCLQEDDDDDEEEEEGSRDHDAENVSQSRTQATQNNEASQPLPDYLNYSQSAASMTAASAMAQSAPRNAPSPLTAPDVDDDDDDEGTMGHAASTSGSVMFESLVHSQSPEDEATHRRRQRIQMERDTSSSRTDNSRRPSRRRRVTRESSDQEDGDGSSSSNDDGSRNLLDSDDEEGNDHAEPDLSQPLDITAPSSPRRPTSRHTHRSREEEEACSSPEIVYGAD